MNFSLFPIAQDLTDDGLLFDAERLRFDLEPHIRGLGDAAAKVLERKAHRSPRLADWLDAPTVQLHQGQADLEGVALDGAVLETVDRGLAGADAESGELVNDLGFGQAGPVAEFVDNLLKVSHYPILFKPA